MSDYADGSQLCADIRVVEILRIVLLDPNITARPTMPVEPIKTNPPPAHFHYAPLSCRPRPQLAVRLRHFLSSTTSE